MAALNPYFAFTNARYLECFKLLRESLKYHGYDIDRLKKIHLRKDPLLNEAITEVYEAAMHLGWKGSRLALLNRINFILSRKKDISVREERLFKRLVRDFRDENGNVEFDRLMYFFPGKSKEFLKRYYRKLKATMNESNTISFLRIFQ